MMTRRELRDSIVRIVYRRAYYPAREMPEQTEDYLRNLQEEPDTLLPEMKAGPEEEDITYIREKVDAILSHTRDLDRLLGTASKEWKVSRIGKMELAILRVAVYEMKFDEDVPEKVAINEAIELAKLYCDEKAAPFINGILNQLLQQ